DYYCGAWDHSLSAYIF
nr:immunoglobulin light chain junction region [Macaca mulatta]